MKLKRRLQLLNSVRLDTYRSLTRDPRGHIQGRYFGTGLLTRLTMLVSNRGTEAEIFIVPP